MLQLLAACILLSTSKTHGRNSNKNYTVAVNLEILKTLLCDVKFHEIFLAVLPSQIHGKSAAVKNEMDNNTSIPKDII